MKLALILIIFICFSIWSNAQSGCTDIHAKNFDAGAKTNDGSCIYPYTQVFPGKKGDFSGIDESSGLVWTDGKLWTFRDGGGPAVIYSIDTADGKILQTVFIDNYTNTDWEDITADSAYIYIEDAGNNDGNRKDLKILKIKKSDITGNTTVHLSAEAINFSYKDQTSFVKSSTHNFDCESLLSIDTNLYVFTKDRGDLSTRSYKLSKKPGTYSLSPYTSYVVSGLVTGADYNTVKKEVVLIGYAKGHENSFIWILNDFKSDSFFNGNKRKIDIGTGYEWQTEGVCYKDSGRLFISCEKAGTYSAGLFAINKSAWLKKTSGIKRTMAGANLRYYPNPAQSYMRFENDQPITRISIENLLGQMLYTENLNDTQYTLQLDKFSHKPGLYNIRVYTEGEVVGVKVEMR